MHSGGITDEAIEAAGRAQEAAGVPPMTGEQVLLVSLLLGPRGDTDRRVRGALFAASCAPWTPLLPRAEADVVLERALADHASR